MPQMKATTNQIKLDFRVSKAYWASTEDWLSKFQACRAITWYKEDTDNWHFDSCWQLYLTQHFLQNSLTFCTTEICCISHFFSLCIQKETGMICLREALKGTPLVTSTWWAPVIAAIQRLGFSSPFFNLAEVLLSEKQSFIHSQRNLKPVLYGGSKKTLCQEANWTSI